MAPANNPGVSAPVTAVCVDSALATAAPIENAPAAAALIEFVSDAATTAYVDGMKTEDAAKEAELLKLFA
ncbi:hypothetical protein FGB62_129g01 [Gracilaria domingensis]|nr:hypothetical protein FGB62_129g01 [Gracilaria domingensis]